MDECLARLRELAGPELYRSNAFRTTGLPIGATRGEVRSRYREAKLQGAVGPGWERVLAAFEVFRDPRHRIVHEMFWYWGSPSGSCGCSPSSLLHQDHDEAVRLHSRLLDAELDASGRGEAAEGRPGAEREWEKAAVLWSALVEREDFWCHLRRRADALDDPRLEPSSVDAVREELPRALVMAVARLAAGAEDADHLVRCCLAWSSLGEHLLDDVFDEVLALSYDSASDALRAAGQQIQNGFPAAAADLLTATAVPVLRRLKPFASHAYQRRAAEMIDLGAARLGACAVLLAGGLPPSTGAAQMRTEVCTTLLGLAEEFAVSPETRSSVSASRSLLHGAPGAGSADRWPEGPGGSAVPSPETFSPQSEVFSHGSGFLRTVAAGFAGFIVTQGVTDNLSAAITIGTASAAVSVFGLWLRSRGRT